MEWSKDGREKTSQEKKEDEQSSSSNMFRFRLFYNTFTSCGSNHSKGFISWGATSFSSQNHHFMYKSSMVQNSFETQVTISSIRAPLYPLVLLQVLEERETLEEIMSSRGRLGPEAWQTLFFVHVCAPCPPLPPVSWLNVALKPSQFFRGIA
jgi:hypothetical protein